MINNVFVVNLDKNVILPNNSKLSDLKEILEDAIPFSCLSGICGSCVIEVKDGIENLSKKNLTETEFLNILGFDGKQYRLACQCRLLGDVKINTVP